MRIIKKADFLKCPPCYREKSAPFRFIMGILGRHDAGVNGHRLEQVGLGSILLRKTMKNRFTFDLPAQLPKIVFGMVKRMFILSNTRDNLTFTAECNHLWLIIRQVTIE